MSIKIPTEQGFVMTYHYDYHDLNKLKNLIKNKGQAIIGNDYLESDNGYLRHFKKPNFQGAYYAMPLEGVIDIIERALIELND